MIKANELRIGNWVQLLERKCKVDAIFITHFRARDINGIDLGDSLRTNYTPIPLTPEILEKAGFKLVELKFPKRFYYVLDCITIYKTRRDSFEYSVDSDEYTQGSGTQGRPIESLHHLQNIYFMFNGDELEINL